MELTKYCDSKNLRELNGHKLIQKNSNYNLIYQLLQKNDVDTLLLIFNMYKYIKKYSNITDPENIIAVIHKCLIVKELRQKVLKQYNNMCIKNSDNDIQIQN